MTELVKDLWEQMTGESPAPQITFVHNYSNNEVLHEYALLQNMYRDVYLTLQEQMARASNLRDRYETLREENKFLEQVNERLERELSSAKAALPLDDIKSVIEACIEELAEPDPWCKLVQATSIDWRSLIDGWRVEGFFRPSRVGPTVPIDYDTDYWQTT